MTLSVPATRSYVGCDSYSWSGDTTSRYVRAIYVESSRYVVMNWYRVNKVRAQHIYGIKQGRLPDDDDAPPLQLVHAQGFKSTNISRGTLVYTLYYFAHLLRADTTQIRGTDG